MSEEYQGSYPTEINLHQQTGVLEMVFGDGAVFHLPAEYLRVHAPEAVLSGILVRGKERVTITRILPEGNQAIRLVYNDGYRDGVYDWKTLYELGEHQAENWRTYLGRLEAVGHVRETDETGPKVKLLFFARLVERLGRGSEEVHLPAAVGNVGELLGWLRSRGGHWQQFLGDDAVHVTVNREFTKLDTPLNEGDEVALVPNHPG